RERPAAGPRRRHRRRHPLRDRGRARQHRRRLARPVSPPRPTMEPRAAPNPGLRRSPLRAALTRLFRRIIGVYFPEIEVLGEAPAKDVRGRLFVSNHVNAIVDPILIFTTAPCDISPIAKSTLWKVPGLRWLLGVVDAVQIVRRVDDPSKQSGSN